MYSNSFGKVYINKVGPTGQNYSDEKELTHVTGGLAHAALKEKSCRTDVTYTLTGKYCSLFTSFFALFHLLHVIVVTWA